jgi:hypothetical protein
MLQTTGSSTILDRTMPDRTIRSRRRGAHSQRLPPTRTHDFLRQAREERPSADQPARNKILPDLRRTLGTPVGESLKGALFDL